MKRLILIDNGHVWLTHDSEGWRFPSTLPDGFIIEEGETFHLDGDTEAPVIQSVDNTQPSLERIELRAAWQLLPDSDYTAAAKGAELIYWRRQNLYCGSCGHPTQRGIEISRRCPACGSEVFPSPAPAVLVLVTRGETALLVHARNFRRNFYGLVAGFVETGESIEECVAREVKEETSLEIDHIRYFGSQTWPFPFNLMIGFTAEYKSGDIRFADNELSAGQFFDREHLPPLPTPPSLARTMIDHWLSLTNQVVSNN